ncbi:MAG: 30S ribosomal protein S9, partial [Microgenomates group bacterium]
MPRKKKVNYMHAVGRRRSASARIRLFKGKGENLVNDLPFEKYFPGEVFKDYYTKPFKLTETLGKYYVT